MRIYQTHTTRVVAAFALGLLAWVLFRFLWILGSLGILGTAYARDAMEMFPFAAISLAIEFALYFAVAALLWVLLQGAKRGVIFAAALGTLVFYVSNAIAVSLIVPVAIPEAPNPGWRSLLPGVQSITHLVAVAFISALMWRVAYVRSREASAVA